MNENLKYVVKRLRLLRCYVFGLFGDIIGGFIFILMKSSGLLIDSVTWREIFLAMLQAAGIFTKEAWGYDKDITLE